MLIYPRRDLSQSITDYPPIRNCHPERDRLAWRLTRAARAKDLGQDSICDLLHQVETHMPTLSSFYGIEIRMYYHDHHASNYHAIDRE